MKKVFKLISGENLLIFIVIFTIVIRLVFGYVYSPLGTREDYWEYGNLAKNLKAGKGYSYLYFEGEKACYKFKSNSQPLPSAYMPPGYVMFIYPFLAIRDVSLRNSLIGIVQSLLYGLVVLMIYIFSAQLFKKETALTAAGIAAILPEFIYLPYTIGPSVLFQLLLLLHFYFLHREKKTYTMLFSGLIGTCLVYLRSEYILFIFIVAFFQYYTKQIKTSIYTILIPLLLICPWAIRNYMAFKKFVPLTTNGGLNFYRGHNPLPGAWVEGLYVIYPGLHISEAYEVDLNNVFFKKGIEFIKTRPGLELFNDIKKIFLFWTIDLSDARSKHIVYWLPWLGLLFLSSIGLYESFNRKKYGLEYIFFIYSSAVVLIFFSQVRYQTIMKIMLVPFAAHGLLFLIRLYKKQNAT